MGYAIRTDKYRYMECYVWGNDKRGAFLTNELFDHTHDQKENVNIAQNLDKQSVVKVLKKQLLENFKK